MLILTRVDPPYVKVIVEKNAICSYFIYAIFIFIVTYEGLLIKVWVTSKI